MTSTASKLIAAIVISCALVTALHSASARPIAGAAPAVPASGTTVAKSGNTIGAVQQDDPRGAIRAAFTPANRLYARVRQGLALIDPLWDIAAALLLLSTGWSARIRDFGARRFRLRYFRVFTYLVLAGAVASLVRLPVEAFRGFWWEHRFGLSNQSGFDWSIEQLKVLGLNLAFMGGSGMLSLALWGIERAGRRGWLWLALGTLPVAVIAVLLQPIVFEPAFNRFTPLGDARLDRRILALAERAGIPARHVVQVDRSRQTRTVNAYVSGFGPSQRIVLWDTTLQRLSEDEILAVMGHEMGHYKLNHLWRGIALMWGLSFIVFFVASLLIDLGLSRWGRQWGVRGPGDEAALPLYALVLTLLLALAQPVVNAFSREIEHEADVFGLEVTHLNAATASAFVKLGAENRSDPDPPVAIRLLLYTHPPLIDRARLALTYHPWREGRANRYYQGPPPGD